MYHYTNGRLWQATIDDWDREQGHITQTLGGAMRYHPVHVHITSEPLTEARLLVATDGVFGSVSRKALTKAMEGPLRDVPEQLLETSIEGGNLDDFSAAVVDVAV